MTDTLLRAHVNFDLIPSGVGLAAGPGNIERWFDPGSGRPAYPVRDVATVIELAALLPEQAAYILQVQALTASLAAMTADRDAKETARATAQTALDAKTAELATANASIATLTTERDTATASLATVTAERDAALAQIPAPIDTSTPEGLGAYAASKRYEVMVHGVPFGGMRIPGDDIAQGRLATAADNLATQSLTEPMTIVLGLTVFTATAAQVNQLRVALAQLTQAAFVVQGQVVTGIVAGTITTPAQIDAAFAAMLA